MQNAHPVDANNLPVPGRKFSVFFKESFDFCQCRYLNVACVCVCVSVKDKISGKHLLLKRLNVEISVFLCCFNSCSVAAMDLSQWQVSASFERSFKHIHQVVLSMTTTVTTMTAGADLRVFWPTLILYILPYLITRSTCIYKDFTTSITYIT